MSAADRAPAAEQTSARPTYAGRTRGRMRRTSVHAADVVPEMLTSLFVPSAVAGANPGTAAMSSGIITSPPPPMTASIQPATRAPPTRTAHAPSSSSTDPPGNSFRGQYD